MDIIEKDRFVAVGIQVSSDWQGLWKEMPRAWDTFRDSGLSIRARASETMMDISLEKSDGRYLQLVAYPVYSFENTPAGMVAVEIPAHRYLYFRHQGPVSTIAESFGQMYDFGKEQGLNTCEFKLDSGYSQRADEKVHDLYIALDGEPDWKLLSR